MTTERRRFLATASGAMAAVAAAAFVDAHQRHRAAEGPVADVHGLDPGARPSQGAAQRLAKVVEETSGGRFRIEVYPGGQIMPPFECFAAASKGTIEAFMAVRILLDREGAGGRVVHGRPVRHGRRRHGRLVLPGTKASSSGRRRTRPSTSCRVLPRRCRRRWPDGSGRRSNTIGDYKGLKMRIGTGLGGKVYVKAGGTAVLTPAAEIYAELERGVIDAAEWIGPHDDMQARPPQDRPVLLLPGLARARQHD